MSKSQNSFFLSRRANYLLGYRFGLLYGWTFSLIMLTPGSAIALDLQNRNRMTDKIWEQVDLRPYHLRNRLNDSQLLNHNDSGFLGDPNFGSAGNKSEVNWNPLYKIVGRSKPEAYAFGPHVLQTDGTKFTVLDCRKGTLKNGISHQPFGIDGMVDITIQLDCFNKRASNERIKPHYLIGQSDVGFGDLSCASVRVESDQCIGRKAVEREEDPVRLNDFAAQYRNSGIAYQTIGSDDNPVASPVNENRRSLSSPTEAKRPADPKALQYMRRNGKGWKIAYFEMKTGEEIEAADFSDIDVSYDAKRWFHHFGPFCLRDSPPLPLSPIK